MPSFSANCPACGRPVQPGLGCSDPECSGAVSAGANAFDKSSLAAMLADIPDPEAAPLEAPPPPPVKRRRPPAEPEPAPPVLVQPPPATPEPPKQRVFQKTMVIEPIPDLTDDDAPTGPRKGAGVLNIVLFVLGLAVLGAVVWLMTNPPQPG